MKSIIKNFGTIIFLTTLCCSIKNKIKWNKWVTCSWSMSHGVHDIDTIICISMSKMYLVNCYILFSRLDFRFNQQILNSKMLFRCHFVSKLVHHMTVTNDVLQTKVYFMWRKASIIFDCRNWKLVGMKRMIWFGWTGDRIPFHETNMFPTSNIGLKDFELFSFLLASKFYGILFQEGFLNIRLDN